MVNTCIVPGCGSRSDRDHDLSFHCLPLTNKPLLKQWLHQIGRKNAPVNQNSRVCSKHFKRSHMRKLRPDEYPTENLPRLATRATTSAPRRSLVRRPLQDQTGMMTVMMVIGWSSCQHKRSVSILMEIRK